MEAPGVVAAAHAGWRGALKGILGNTVRAMGEYGIQASDIKACIGPCIDRRSYEVGQDLYEQVVRVDEVYERFFHAGQCDGHYQFDLSGFCAQRLYEAGVRDVHIVGMDTYADQDRFFSYRRSCHRGETDYGGQISVIALPKRA